MADRYEELKNYIKQYDSIAVAYSGGVDSTLLLFAAAEALDGRVLALTADTGSVPDRELISAKEYCGYLGVKHRVITTHVLELSELSGNPKERCYICKKHIYSKFLTAASEEGYKQLAEGSNADDFNTYRPGLRALKELGIISPYMELGITREEIEVMSKELNLPTFDKPSFACLFTRFPYGEEITEPKLKRVDKAEQLLLDMGFRQLRVRSHGDIARIELMPEDMEYFMKDDVRSSVYENFRRLGYTYVTLDILGFRSGSMDEGGAIIPEV